MLKSNPSASITWKREILHNTPTWNNFVSETEPRHPLLWSHYTLDGSGVVIGYNFSELEGAAADLNGRLSSVTYEDSPPPITGYKELNDENFRVLLSGKSRHWRHEEEWRLIAELAQTVGTGKVDLQGHPVNLITLPNSAVEAIYYTERTPPETISTIQNRIRDSNNRYKVKQLTKLVLSRDTYEYEVASQ